MNKPRMHFVPKYFLEPVHPITVALIGAGGSGSQMLSALARIDCALRQLGQPGLHVTVYDPDTVQEPNIGRQLFTAADLGRNKAECLVTRFNRIFGNEWEAIPEKLDCKKVSDLKYNIFITCVDNIALRKDLGKYLSKQLKKRNNRYADEFTTYYWLDLGNGQRTGQAILGSTWIEQAKTAKYEPVPQLPLVTQMFDYDKIRDRDSGPSCSLAEALEKQDLFINSSLVQVAGSLLWTLLTSVGIDTRGFYINLDTFKMTSIPV